VDTSAAVNRITLSVASGSQKRLRVVFTLRIVTPEKPRSDRTDGRRTGAQQVIEVAPSMAPNAVPPASVASVVARRKEKTCNGTSTPNNADMSNAAAMNGGSTSRETPCALMETTWLDQR
jgi:hypothetical protein